MPSFDGTVYIVDPDDSLRAALAAAIRGGGWGAETFPTAGAFLARPRLPAPACVLMELALPDLDGMDLLRCIVAERANVPVIVLSGPNDIPTTVRAMKEGALEFLLKPAPDELLLAAVEQALARSHAVHQLEAELLDMRLRYHSLSGREREVMTCVVSGFLNKQAGARLGISVITVKAHRGRVMRKMGANSLAELVSIALRLRLPLLPATRTAPSIWSGSIDRTNDLTGRGSMREMSRSA